MFNILPYRWVDVKSFFEKNNIFFGFRIRKKKKTWSHAGHDSRQERISWETRNIIIISQKRRFCKCNWKQIMKFCDVHKKFLWSFDKLPIANAGKLCYNVTIYIYTMWIQKSKEKDTMKKLKKHHNVQKTKGIISRSNMF